MTINRRDFVKTSTVATTGLILGMNLPMGPKSALGPAADRDHDVIGKAAQIGRRRGKVHLRKTAERLGGQHVFADTVEMVDHRHPAPANAKGRLDMGLRPVHQLHQIGRASCRERVLQVV